MGTLDLDNHHQSLAADRSLDLTCWGWGHFCLKCFEAVGWVTGRASGL